MALRRKTRRTAVLLALLLLFAALAAFDAWRLARVQDWNRATADASIVTVAEPSPPEALFAQAYHLARRGEHQRALDLYQRVRSARVDAALRAAAKYNSANIYLRQGREMRGAKSGQQALPLLELAKEAYRQALRDNSGDWDAKYNLERALRLAPEPEEKEVVDSGPPRNRERAPATVRAFSFGLP